MSFTELLVATSNAGKLREIQALLADLEISLLSLADFSEIEVVPETASTFADNAALKAVGYARQAAVLTLADDSGLAVDALGGAPGVHSARYQGADASYDVRLRALLAEMKEAASKTRTARFVCALAIASPDAQIIFTTEATVEGHIAEQAAGSGGFGYDPIFVPAGFDRTFGELPADLKNRISHRGRALVAAREFLVSLTTTSTPR